MPICKAPAGQFLQNRSIFTKQSFVAVPLLDYSVTSDTGSHLEIVILIPAATWLSCTLKLCEIFVHLRSNMLA